MKLCCDFGILVDKHLNDFITHKIVPSPMVRKIVAHYVDGFQNGLFILTAAARYRITDTFDHPDQIESLLERDWSSEKAWDCKDLTDNQRTAFFSWLKIECLIHLNHSIQHDEPPREI